MLYCIHRWWLLSLPVLLSGFWSVWLCPRKAAQREVFHMDITSFRMYLMENKDTIWCMFGKPTQRNRCLNRSLKPARVCVGKGGEAPWIPCCPECVLQINSINVTGELVRNRVWSPASLNQNLHFSKIPSWFTCTLTKVTELIEGTLEAGEGAGIGCGLQEMRSLGDTAEQASKSWYLVGQ